MIKLALALFVLAGLSFIALILQVVLGYPVKDYHIPLGLLFLICSLLIWHVVALKTSGPRNLFPFQPPIERSKHPIIYTLVPWIFIFLHSTFALTVLLHLLFGR